jgi:hypothetical protein
MGGKEQKVGSPDIDIYAKGMGVIELWDEQRYCCSIYCQYNAAGMTSDRS